MSGLPGAVTPGSADQTAKKVDDAFARRSNVFNEMVVEDMVTQWKHKISVVPETEGITSRWWDFTSGVSRSGPTANVPSGESIMTNQSGEYEVGSTALAGGGVRFGDTLPQDGADDWWTGFTNRLTPNVSSPDGAGIGVRYFNAGEGDEGGAKTDGVQPYVWLDSGVSNVPNKVVPKDQWDNRVDVSLFQNGGFLRLPHTFYDHGEVGVNWGVKDRGRLVIKRLHTFTVEDKEMWKRSDLQWQMEALGSDLDSFIAAAHYKSGGEGRTIRENAEGRDGTVFGDSVSVSQGTPVPIISIKLRAGWENVNVKPLGLSVNMDDSFYVFVSVGSDLQNANFREPGSDISAFDQDSSEYAVLADNQATGFGTGGAGDVEYKEYAPGAGRSVSSASISDELEDFGLSNGVVATLGVVPVDATSFNGSSLRWGMNF